MRNMPFILKKMILDLWTEGGVCDFYLSFWVFAAFFYVLSPLDIIPEAIYGFIGLLDDIFIILVIAVCLSRCVYSRYTGRYSQPPEPQPNIINP